MANRIPISAIMTKNIVTANVTDSLKHICSLLKQHQMKHLPVVSGRSLVGMISEADILRLSFADIYESEENVDETIFDMLRTEQVMIHNPATLDVNDCVKDVAAIMSNADFKALPILDEGKIVGIIASADLIKHFLLQYQ